MIDPKATVSLKASMAVMGSPSRQGMKARKSIYTRELASRTDESLVCVDCWPKREGESLD